jgi:hypothetical protein
MPSLGVRFLCHKPSGFSCRFLENLPFLCLIAADSFSYKRFTSDPGYFNFQGRARLFLKQENSNVNLDQINQNMCILLCHRLLAKRPIQSKQQCIATQGHRKGGTGGPTDPQSHKNFCRGIEVKLRSFK